MSRHRNLTEGPSWAWGPQRGVHGQRGGGSAPATRRQVQARAGGPAQRFPRGVGPASEGQGWRGRDAERRGVRRWGRHWKRRQVHLLSCWWECKLVQPLWRTEWRFLKRLKRVAVESSSLTPGHISRQNCNSKRYMHPMSHQHCSQ